MRVATREQAILAGCGCGKSSTDGPFARRESVIDVRDVGAGGGIMGALIRGLRNPRRNLARSVLVVLLLSVIMGVFVIMVQAAAFTRQQLSQLEARVHTLIELREAGAFGTGGVRRR
jgi:hypothetical protein